MFWFFIIMGPVKNMSIYWKLSEFKLKTRQNSKKIGHFNEKHYRQIFYWNLYQLFKQYNSSFTPKVVTQG